MPPKKKSNKKAADDWESELGEPVAPAPAQDATDAPADAEADAEEEFPAGGLMAMMRKRNKKKKGGPQEDFVEGADAPTEEPNLDEKAPVEASLEDEFALPDKKGKGKAAPAKALKADDEDDERGADGKVLTKAQKEKLKKEREKQRKKENVCSFPGHMSRTGSNS